MHPADPPSFETDDHKRIYECVERHGAVSPSEIHERVQLESDQIAEAVIDLEGGGYLRERGGRFQLALGTDLETTHHLDGTTVTIRSTRPEDLPAVSETIQRVIADALYPSAEELTARLTRDGSLKRHNDTETRVFFVPTIDDDIVGWVHVGTSTLQRVRRTVEITLGVRPGDRERGIGSRLLERGCEWAASNDYRRASQRLPATNDRALAFLESRDWEVETIRRNRYGGDGERIDEVELAFEL